MGSRGAVSELSMIFPLHLSSCLRIGLAVWNSVIEVEMIGLCGIVDSPLLGL